MYFRTPLEYEVLLEWRKKPVKGLTYPQLIHRLNTELLPAVLPYVNDRVVAIDYTPYEIFMRTGKSIIVQKTFIVGYMFRAITDAGGYPVSISASYIRTQFGLKRNVSKQDVHSRLRSQFFVGTKTPSRKITEDLFDSLILAHVALEALRKNVLAPSRPMRMEMLL